MATPLPAWAESIRSTYLRGEASVFILHGNVYDLVHHDGKLWPLTDFLRDLLLAKKEVVLRYDPSAGIRTLKRGKVLTAVESLTGTSPAPLEALPALEKILRANDGVALIIDYVELLAPGGDVSFMAEADRRALATLHRWSLDPRFDEADNVVILITENLPDVSSRLVNNPRVSTVEVPLPTDQTRSEILRLLEADATPREIERLSQLSAGLKAIQIRAIVNPGEGNDTDYADHYELARSAFEGAPDAAKRARNLARQFYGKPLAELKVYLRDHGYDPQRATDRYDEVFDLLAAKKRAILEKECFGLIEFVEPDHDFPRSAGSTRSSASSCRSRGTFARGAPTACRWASCSRARWERARPSSPRPSARSSGLTAIKLKNFRSKWVGATEGNLEKILSVVRAIGNVLVIIDEGDRAFGATGESDGGTSSRVIARIKEFMSDPRNRGRVLFVLMTNRPDRLDIDIKRAGRLDRKIPFFYAQDAEEVEPVLMAQLRRHRIQHQLELPRDRDRTTARLVGWSNADIGRCG
ncbi:MAG: AAA family ATPase, partial [Myxococcales bacterium]|nr:AAA family ATPase [Myxococcales bacterium]